MDPYKILNIHKTATLKEIKSAYLKMAKKYHPDKYQDNEDMAKLASEKMSEVNEAYNQIYTSANEKQEGQQKKGHQDEYDNGWDGYSSAYGYGYEEGTYEERSEDYTGSDFYNQNSSTHQSDNSKGQGTPYRYTSGQDLSKSKSSVFRELFEGFSRLHFILRLVISIVVLWALIVGLDYIVPRNLYTISSIFVLLFICATVVLNIVILIRSIIRKFKDTKDSY